MSDRAYITSFTIQSIHTGLRTVHSRIETNSEKQQLSEWEASLPRFQKISFVTGVYQRQHFLPTEYKRRNEHNIRHGLLYLPWMEDLTMFKMV